MRRPMLLTSNELNAFVRVVVFHQRVLRQLGAPAPDTYAHLISFDTHLKSLEYLHLIS